MSLFGLPILFGPMHIAFLEMVIDPVCSLVFEAESEEDDVMSRDAIFVQPQPRADEGESIHVIVGFVNRERAFASGQPGFQYKEAFDWIPSFGIQYKVGVDGLSVLMVVLTTTLTWISILASFGPIKDRVKGYMISFLVLEVGMIGVFVALDLFLFYIFWRSSWSRCT